jgi:phospholipid-binding lipoprotein MlaA
MSISCRKVSLGWRVSGFHITWWILVVSALLFDALPIPGYAEPRLPFSSKGDPNTILRIDPPVRVAEGAQDVEVPGFAEPVKPIADPLEPVNRLFFHINDKFYFWLLKPVASGYAAIFPQPVRVCVRNFFDNVATPIRAANCLLQLNLEDFGNETARFVVNSTVGLAGFFDPAKKRYNIKRQEEDFGQTLGSYGIGPAFYINWPVFGPSSLRDTIGTVGDFFLTPRTYLVEFPILVNVGLATYERVNNTSLMLGEYEDLKEAALDPYVALRDAYHQFRQEKIKER